MKICRHPNVGAFLARAGAWLVRREAEHNVLLGVTEQLARGDHMFKAPIYLATVEIGTDIAGCAFRTPPFKLGLTRLPLPAIPLLVQDAGEVFDSLPGVLGPHQEAKTFAEHWVQHFGGRVSMGTRQGIHSLETVAYSATDIPGSLRRAESSDRALVRRWVDGFAHDTGIADADPHERAERLICNDALFLWEDGEPRSMAAAAASTPSGVRVGYVYTPSEFRSRGYATAAVASLTQSLLDNGHRFCCLYTDLSNPVSNAIYERIGYRQLCEVVDANIL